jgi:hypothetical protein
VPREQNSGPDFGQLSFNRVPKTIVISGANGQFNAEDPNMIESVLNAVNNQFKDNKNSVNNQIPELLLKSPEQRLPEQALGQPMETVSQKVYKLPAITRMISSEVEPDNKKNSLWRSPLPFLHSEDCPHQKKSKTSRRKSKNLKTY